MCFKWGIAVILSGAIALSGCGLKLNEKASQPSAISYSGKDYSCVSQIPQHIEQYVNDQMTDEQITDFTGCLKNAFQSFANYTRGREESTYSADEIRNFLERSFIKDRTISDQLLHEFMVIKQALVGGDSVRIARSELFDAIDFIDDIRAEAIRMRPYIRYLNPRLIREDAAKTNSDNWKYIDSHLMEANAALNQSIGTIAARLEKSKKEYPLDNLEAFLTEFRAFVHWEEHFPDARPVPQWKALLRSFKEITVSPQKPDVIRVGDWKPLLQSVSEWYLTYLEYDIGVKGKRVMEDQGLQNTINLVNEMLHLTRTAIWKQPKEITFDQLSRLTVALHDLGWIPDYIRTTSIDQAARALVTRMAGQSSTSPDEREGKVKGLTIPALDVFESEFTRWANVQITLDSRFKKTNAFSLDNVPPIKSHIGMLPEVKIGNTTADSMVSDADWVEFDKVETFLRPLFPDGFPRVELVPNSLNQRYGVYNGFYNLSFLNLFRAGGALVFRGYARDVGKSGLWTAGIRSTELQKFYVDFRDIGIDLAIVDRNNTNAGSRAFVEAKLFTSSAQGLNYDPRNPDAGELNFVEAIEYFAYLYSGGMMARDVYKDLSKLCPLGPEDDNGSPAVSRACAIGLMPGLFDEYMVNLPFLQDFMKKSTADQRLAFTNTLVLATCSECVDGKGPQWMQMSEISTMTVVTHYVESTMIRFDANQDGLLSNSELEKAVPIFAGFLKKIAKDTLNKELSDSQARAAFFYILKYQSIPSTNWDNFFVYKNEWMEPTLSMSRQQLAEVFKSIIGNLLAMGKNTPPPAPTAQLKGTKVMEAGMPALPALKTTR